MLFQRFRHRPPASCIRQPPGWFCQLSSVPFSPGRTPCFPVGSGTAIGKPVPGAMLRLRDETGRVVVGTVNVDPRGTVCHRGLQELSKHEIDGFALSRRSLDRR